MSERNDLEREVAGWLGQVEPGEAGRAVLARIGGQTPKDLVEARKIRRLRGLSGAAALVLGGLFLFGSVEEQSRGFGGTSLAAVVAIDLTELDQLPTDQDLFSELFDVEYPE